MAKKKTAPGRTPRKPYQVFISHATADKWIAVKICESIEKFGAKTFRDDRDINGGDDIPEEIRRQIKQSREMLVLWTPESMNRPWVTLEIGAAWGEGKRMRITIVRYHVPVDTVPAMLKNRKSITLNEVDQYLDELKNRI
jgi:TIR domain